ncbi:MAG: maltose/maltodextrin ABC transporter substrate-binding protein MalE [Bacteriovoracaceae bacterium]|nr:maltose/maltodextrin ABC transporter substrate-binding protein MalE [Bacteriovoracaceae bacterium]
MKFLILLSFLCSIGVHSAELEIWTSSENVARAIKKRVGLFKQDFKADVKISVLNKDLTTQFKTAALSAKGPDILCWAHDVVGELAQSGLIEPIAMPPKLRKALLPVSLKAFEYKSKLYGYPYDIEAVALFYNKDLLPTPPKTMEELIQFSIELRKEKKETYGFLYDIANFFFSFPIISAGGGYVFKQGKDGLNVQDVGLANNGAISGANFIRSLVEKDVVPSSTDRSIAFEKMKQGKLAATIDGPWAVKELKNIGLNFGVVPIPSIGGKTPRPFVGTHGFIIRRSSPNKELAKEFIEKYLMTKKGILTLYEEDPRGPSRMDAMEILSKKDPLLRQFMESASNGIPMPNVPEMGAVWGAAGNALGLLTKGTLSPKEAMTQSVNQIKSSLSKN